MGNKKAAFPMGKDGGYSKAPGNWLRAHFGC